MRWWTAIRQAITFLAGVLIILDAVLANSNRPLLQVILGLVLMGMLPADVLITGGGSNKKLD